MAASDTYRSQIRSAVRGLWSGALSLAQFREAMQSAIRRGLTRAWREGAAKCGVAANELSADELDALAKAVEDEYGYIGNFAGAVREQDKLGGGKLQPLFDRAELWANRYPDIVNRAQVMACGDKKLEWILGPTEEHCADCSKYNGRVYRASTWAKADIRPQHSGLACHGFQCLCRFEPTDKKLTRGKPPGMTG